MSNKYFDYKCLPPRSLSSNELDSFLRLSNPNADVEEARERAFRFFYTKNNGKNAIQIIIPEQFLKKGSLKSCDEIRVFAKSGKYNAEEFSYTDVDESEVVREKVSNVIETGCIYVERDDISCIGEIRFFSKGKDLQTDNCLFAVAFIEKELISYSLAVKGSAIEYKIEYPLIRTEIKLSLAEKANLKPILAKDFKIPSTGSEKTDCITLAPRLGRSNIICGKILLRREIKNERFALVFSNEDLNDSYMLRDDTVFNADTQEAVYNPEPRCPFCNEKMHLDGLKLQKGHVYTCDGLERTGLNLLKERKNKINIVCKKDFTSSYLIEGESIGDKRFYEYKEYTIKNPLLPDDYMNKKSLKVAVAGMSGSGKTFYLQSLFEMKDKTDGDNQTSGERFKKITEVFNIKLDGSLLLDYENINDFSVDPLSNSTSKLNDLRRNGGLIDNARVEAFYKRFEMKNVKENGIKSRTQTIDAEPLAENPVGFDLGRLGYAYFYDMPGELIVNYVKTNRIDYQKSKAFANSDSIIAIVDGYPNADNAQLSIAERNRLTIQGLNNTINFLKEYYKVSDAKINLDHTQNQNVIRNISEVPIAIVLSKYDMRLASTSLDSPDECFGENTHVTMEDMDFKHSKKYEGSEIQRHIDASSDEIRSFFLSLAGGKEIIESIEKYTSNIKYFACSAIGFNECVEANSDKTIRFVTQPRMKRIEYPVIWLMHKIGMI